MAPVAEATAESLAEALAYLPKDERLRVLDTMAEDEARALTHDWRFWARPKQLPPDGDWRTWVIRAGRGFGKALALDTPLPTPDGWTTMGEVSVGDTLFDRHGQVCTVTHVTPIQLGNPCYRVQFSDGTEIVADRDHRWVTWDGRARKSHGRADNPQIHPEVRTTAEIRATLRYGKRGDLNHSVVNTAPLEGPERDLPVDPYVLGVWLGDGHTNSAEITTMDSEVVGEIRLRGLEMRRRPYTERTGLAHVYGVGARPALRDATTGQMVANDSLHSRLSRLGVLGDKHVPDFYLRSSEGQRRDLLMGLMDSDGTARNDATSVAFTSTNRNLTDAVEELALSMGYTCHRDQRPARLDGVDYGTSYRVRFRPLDQVFHVSRKAERLKLGGSQESRHRQRMIAGVEPTDSVPVRCISVDSPSRTYLAGRAMVPTHNTRAGAEWLHERARSEPGRHMALVAQTPADARDYCVEGPGGLLQNRPLWCVNAGEGWPNYEPSKRRVTWPNGSQATIYSSEEPRQLRGFGGDTAWLDEFAKWTIPRECWDNLMFGMREASSDRPRVCITTTPRPLKILAEIEAKDSTHVVTGSSYENRANLDPTWFDEILADYEGTTIGRQELYAEILDEYPGALWSRTLLRSSHMKPDEGVPDLSRVVVAVDPAVTSGEDSDETGIIVAGRSREGAAYVLDDRTCRKSPDGWAEVVVSAYNDHKADRVVAEVNNGGDLVETVLRTHNHAVSYKPVRASRGKRTRAEPVAALYEQGKVRHAPGLDALEDQMVSFMPDTRESPDRVDALVWALTELMVSSGRPGKPRVVHR